MAYQIQNNEYNNQTRRQNNLFIFFSFAHSSLAPTVLEPGMRILFIRIDRVVLKIKTFQGRKKMSKTCSLPNQIEFKSISRTRNS